MPSAYLPRKEHDLRYTEPAMSWDEALPLGNGIMGALIWGDGQPLNISLDRADLWDLRPVPEFHTPDYTFWTMKQWHEQGRVDDLIRLYEDPYSRPDAPTKIPAGRIEIVFEHSPRFSSTRLCILDAVASVEWGRGMRMEGFIHARNPMGMIRLDTDRPFSARLIAPPFGGEPLEKTSLNASLSNMALSHLGYPEPETFSGENWQAFTQQGAEGFHFAVYCAWKKGARGCLLAWSIASFFDGDDPLTIARNHVETALQTGYARMLITHSSWWKAYWSKATIRIPNPTLEQQWYLDQYKFGAASRRGAPPITLQGPWTADHRCIPPWKGDYHHDLNTQLSYWPCYSGNRLEEGLSYLDWLWETLPACYEWTRNFFRMSGLNIPGVADYNNRPIGGWRQYTHAITTGAWIAHHFYLHWRYSRDRRFLRARTYPFIREVGIFLEAISAVRDEEGKRTLPLSASPEINDNRPEAWFDTITNYDLALIRWLFSAAIELAEELKIIRDANRWRVALAELPDFALGEDGRLLIAPGYPLEESHRHFSHLMAIHPLGMIDREDGASAQRIIDASLNDLDRLGTDWWCGYSYAWMANLAARNGDGDGAERALEIFSTAFTLRNSFHCNGDQSGKGYSKYTYRPFTLEGNFAAAAGLQEMLLQSHRGWIRIFPAIPDTWRDVEFTTLRAEGGFLVSARRVGGVTRHVEIYAEKNGICRLVSPFDGKRLTLKMQRKTRVTLTEKS